MEVLEGGPAASNPDGQQMQGELAHLVTTDSSEDLQVLEGH